MADGLGGLSRRIRPLSRGAADAGRVRAYRPASPAGSRRSSTRTSSPRQAVVAAALTQVKAWPSRESIFCGRNDREIPTTLASAFFLAVVVAAFVSFMALLAYGLIVAGEAAERPAADDAAGVATRPIAEARTARAPADTAARLDKAA